MELDATQEIETAPLIAERSAAYKERNITEFEFRLIRDHIHDYCGIYFEDSKIQTLASRLSPRMMVLDIGSFSEYCNYLRFHPRGMEEMTELIPRLTNNETYFFREINQLSFIAARLKEKIKAGSSAPFRVLSCGCSSGEEAYTLAMMLEEAGLLDECRVEITGMDIDDKILKKAKAAAYTDYSLRATSREMAAKYFVKNGDKYLLHKRIRERVKFLHGNLVDHETFKAINGLDAILCRNVFIYFSDAAIGRAVESFYDSLSDDGRLLLGHSESLSRITDIFHIERHPNAIVYVKKEI